MILVIFSEPFVVLLVKAGKNMNKNFKLEILLQETKCFARP